MSSIITDQLPADQFNVRSGRRSHRYHPRSLPSAHQEATHARPS